MTSPHLASSVRHVLEAATLAPSVHNTQPWRFVVREDGFDLLADPERRLSVLDPTGRQLHLSCGAALVTAGVAARALELDAVVTLLPDPDDPSLLATLRLEPGAPASDRDMALALAVLRRHTVRDAFEPREVRSELLEDLREAAEAEGAALRVLTDEGDLVSLAVLLSGADWAEERDPAYRRELSSWVRDGEEPDGIPRAALPHDPARGSALRMRDFELTHPERLTTGAPPEPEHPAVAVLTTAGDGPRAWLAGGQAMGAVLLHAAAVGVQAQPLGQVTDLPGPRWALRGALGLTGTPQRVLRMGYAKGVAGTPRRNLSEVTG